MKEALINKTAYHGFCYNVSNFKHERISDIKLRAMVSVNIKIISFKQIVKHFLLINWRQ